MTTKLFFTVLPAFSGAASLFAQASPAMNTARMGGPDISEAVRLLEQNALIALIGAIFLMGIVWVCFVIKACAGLNKPEGNRIGPLMPLLVFIAGLSVFGSSCTAQQRAMAAWYSGVEAIEDRTCTCPMQHQSGNMPFGNRYPYHVYSNGQGPAFCKHCGGRTYNSAH